MVKAVASDSLWQPAPTAAPRATGWDAPPRGGHTLRVIERAARRDPRGADGTRDPSADDPLAPAAAPELHAFYERAFRGEHAALEIEQDGRGYLLTAAPLESDAQGVARIVVVAHDVTERQRAERELLATRRRLLAMLEHTTDAFFELDAHFTVTYLNAKALRMLQIQRAAILGKNLWTVFPEAVGSPFCEHYHRALREQVAIDFEAYYPPLATWYEVHVYPTPSSLSVYFRDVNDRHQRAAALHAATERALHAQRIARLGDWQWELATDQVTWPPMVYDILHCDPDQPPPGFRDTPALFLPADGVRLRQAVARALTEGLPYELELRRRQPDGALHTLLVRGELVRAADGSAQALRGFIQDISARKASEEALRQARDAAQAADRSKSEFLANMGHELRTPMNGIMGALQLLRETALSAEQQRYTRIAWDAAKGLLRMMNDILDFARLEAGQTASRSVPFAIAPVLAGMFKPFAAAIERKRLETGCWIAPEVPEIAIGDAGRLRQALFHLVDNAIKFTERGRIDLEAALTGAPAGDTSSAHWLRITVRDTGVGMPSEHIEKMLAPFQQGDGSLQRRHPGAGLGLSLAQRLIAGMGGRMRLDSVPGAGTAVEILLPLTPPAIVPEPSAALPDAQVPPSAPAASPQPQAAPTPGARLRIVLGEDEPANRIMMQRLLEKLGHEVIAARDGEEVLQRLRTAPADVVLMDIEMPGLDGLQTTRIIREQPEYAHCARMPIVAVTGHAMPGERERLLAAGLDDYLPKPITLAALAALIERIAAHGV